MTLLVNGEPRLVLQARNLSELMVELDLPAPVLLAEHNGRALRREEWSECRLAEEDRIELVQIVAGG